MTFDIIYADPPWTFKNYSDSSATKWVGDQYELMSLDDVCNLPVNDIASTDAVLFLWATFPTFPNALKVMESWGFEYKTAGFVWTKKNKIKDSLFWGMGYWTRSNAEICLIGVKGKPLPRVSRSVHQIILEPVRKHSQKPDSVRDKIVELLGDRPRIELFAREKVEGWYSWGNEINSDIVLETENVTIST